MIDNVGVFTQDFKLINAPRTARVGHIIRNPNWDNLKKMEFIIKEIKYQKIEELQLDDQNSQINDSEFLNKKISGLMPAKFTQKVGKFVKQLTQFNINEVGHLDEVFDFDQSMEIAQDWFKSLKTMKGNQSRWKSVIDMITEPLDKWQKDLIVKIKDQKELYTKALNKTIEIDEFKIQDKLNKQKDVMDSWVLQEQKAISEKIGKMFKGIDIIFEGLRKKNEFFLNTDILRSTPVGEVVKYAYQNIAQIRSGLEKSEEELYQISEKINSIRKTVAETNLSAEEKIELLNLELQNKKQTQEEDIRKLKQENDRKISKFENNLQEIEENFEQIKVIIGKKMEDCIKDMDLLRSFQIDDQLTKIAKPTLRVFIPIGIGIIEDEDFDERIEIVFPSYVSSTFERINLCEEIDEYEKEISEILDSNMKLRSTFEFTAANSPNYKPHIING